MRVLTGIVFLICIGTVLLSQDLRPEIGPGSAESKKATRAARAFAQAVASEGTPEYTSALRKSLALAKGLPVGEDANRALNQVSKRGAVDLDSRYRANFSNAQDNIRIWGGERVPTNTYLDTVAITGNGGLCTGTIIASNAVLTAAHCFCGGVAEKVYFGDSINMPASTALVDKTKSKSMIQCTADSKDGDVAVLMLSAPVQISPRALADTALINGATIGRAVGFGLTSTPVTEPAGIKRRVDVPVASVDCNGTVNTAEGAIMDSAFYGCSTLRELVAGAPSLDKDSCNGDSGGPFLVQSQNGNLYLAATTSRATGPPGLRPCGDGGIYVRTDGQVTQWIRSLGINIRVGPPV
jgi:secreted trypsin-like serine protease